MPIAELIRRGHTIVEAADAPVFCALLALEQRQYRAALPPVRIIHTIISPRRDVVGLFVEGQHFDRADGESEDELCRRAMRAVGWDD